MRFASPNAAIHIAFRRFVKQDLRVSQGFAGAATQLACAREGLGSEGCGLVLLSDYPDFVVSIVTRPQMIGELGVVTTRQHVEQKPRMQIRTQTNTSIDAARAMDRLPKNVATGMGNR